MAPFYTARVNILFNRILSELSEVGAAAWGIIDEFQNGTRPAACRRSLVCVESRALCLVRSWRRVIRAAHNITGDDAVKITSDHSAKFREEVQNISAAFAFFGIEF